MVTPPTLILAIDPGPEHSAWVVLRDGLPTHAGYEQNAVDGRHFRHWACWGVHGITHAQPVIEWMSFMGGGVGYTTFNTCAIVGRLAEYLAYVAVYPLSKAAALLYRIDVKRHFLHKPTGTDGQIAAAIYERHGGSNRAAFGTAKAPGPLWPLACGVGSRGHTLAAYAVGLAWHEGMRSEVKGLAQ